MKDEKFVASFPNGSKFLYIQTWRFIFLSILSMGIFDAYWIYKNWRYLKERDDLFIKPFWRGSFGIFFIHSLLDEIYSDEETNSIKEAEFPAKMLATFWLVLIVGSRLLGRVENLEINVIALFLSLLSILFLLPVQKYINDVNEALETPPEYHEWSGGQILCLIAGIVMWFFTILGFIAIANPRLFY